MQWPLKNGIRNLISRPATQPLLLQLLKFCHAGLNYGGGQSVHASGEVGALEFLRDAFSQPRPFTVIDVGANDGEYLHFALQTFGSLPLAAYAFEPQSVSFESLRERFGKHPSVKLKKIALGSTEGSAEIFFSMEGETTASLKNQTIGTQSNAQEMRSEIVQLSHSGPGVPRGRY